MDSVTQFALGAAIGVAVIGKRAPVWRSALWGGLCGTLPDLDVMIDRGDPISAMTLHRTTTHALFYQTLAAPVIGWLISRLQQVGQRGQDQPGEGGPSQGKPNQGKAEQGKRGQGRFWRWTLVAWLALVTHPLLDALTVYGTQLGLPFTDYPFYTGSVFVIDPVVTLALLAGLAIALVRGPPGLRWNRIGLALACAYLGWGLYAQGQVREATQASLASAGITPARVLITPTAFNTVLWRIVVMTDGEDWYEGFHSLLDSPEPITFTRRQTDVAARQRHAGNGYLERVAWFSHGFFDVAETADGLRLRDLRMGLGDQYTFTFVVPPALAQPGPLPPAGAGPGIGAAHAGVAADTAAPSTVTQVPYRVNFRVALPWLWQRIKGQRLPLPDLSPALPKAPVTAH